MTELLPCPFCGGPALFEYVRSGCTMSSGMEPPTCYAGCKKCGVRFSGGETQGWDPTRRWYDRLKEAHDKAAENWNHRHSAEIAGALRDAERLDWMIGNCAVLETNGYGDWRIKYHWTSPITYGPYADAPRSAIDSAMQQGGGGGEAAA